MTRHIFKSFEAFEESETAGNYENVTIIDYNNRVCADLMTETKSLKVAFNRFFKQLADFHVFDGWRDGMEESIENGYWSDSETYWNDETNKSEYRGGWFYTVEDNDGSFYIALNVIK